MTSGVDLDLLTAPFTPQIGLIGLLKTAAPDPVTDAVAPRLQVPVLLFGDAARVPKYMGTQAAMGVAAQDIAIDFGTVQGRRLLTEAQHLLGPQG